MPKFDRHNPPSVEAFRKAGFRVWLKHIRVVLTKEQRNPLYLKFIKKHLNGNLMPLSEIRKLNLQSLIFARGGKIECEIQTPHGEKFNTVAHCSLGDTFNKRVGVNRVLWDIYGQIIKSGIEIK